jgi:hypothetical protein
MTKRTAVPTNTLPVGSIIFGAPKVDHEIVVTYKNGRTEVVNVLPTEHQAKTYAFGLRRQFSNVEVRPAASEPAEAPATPQVTRSEFWGLS